jgi:hypothetical protein
MNIFQNQKKNPIKHGFPINVIDDLLDYSVSVHEHQNYEILQEFLIE